MFKPLLAAAFAAGSLATPSLQAQGETPAPLHRLPVGPYGAEVRAMAPAPALSNLDTRWEIRASDVTLARTFERWAAAAGHKLKWDAARNFLVGASDTYVGTFEGALQHVLSSPGIRYSDFPLEACIYTNNPPLVRVTRQGEQSRECAAAVAP